MIEGEDEIMENYGNLRYSHTFRGEWPSFALFMKRTTSFQITLSEPTTLSLYGCGNSSQVYALCMHRPNGRAILRARFEGIQGDGGNRVIMYIDKNKGTFFSFSLFRDYFLFLSEKHVKNTLI